MRGQSAPPGAARAAAVRTAAATKQVGAGCGHRFAPRVGRPGRAVGSVPPLGARPGRRCRVEAGPGLAASGALPSAGDQGPSGGAAEGARGARAGCVHRPPLAPAGPPGPLGVPLGVPPGVAEPPKFAGSGWSRTALPDAAAAPGDRAAAPGERRWQARAGSRSAGPPCGCRQLLSKFLKRGRALPPSPLSEPRTRRAS